MRIKEAVQFIIVVFTVTVILETGETFQFENAEYGKAVFRGNYAEAWGTESVRKKFPSKIDQITTRMRGGAYQMLDTRSYWVITEEKEGTLLGIFNESSVSEIYKGFA